MVCKKPIAIRLKNGKLIKNPITGEEFTGLLVPCGKCVLCKIQKTREWTLRCNLELLYWDSALFTTLTYDDEHLPFNASLVKKDLQDFIKRLREDFKKPLKYFACGEYGEKGRPHYHLIVFGIGTDLDYNYELGCHYSFGHFVENNWNYGNVFNGSVTANSVRYCAGYIFKKYGSKVNQKIYTDVGIIPPFQLQSNGIGKRWYQDYTDLLWKRGYILLNGERYAIPRYFIDKMKTEDIDRYTELVKTGALLSFDDELTDFAKKVTKIVGYDVKPDDLNRREFYRKLTSWESFQNYIKADVELKRMEIFKK